MAYLGVALFRPLYGNLMHWAFYINASTPIVAEVVGEHPSFMRSIEHKMTPEQDTTRRHVKTIELCELDTQAQVDQAVRIIEDQEIHNDVAE